MNRVSLIVWMWVFIVSSMIAADNYIVLTHGDKERLSVEKSKYAHFLEKHNKTHVSMDIQTVGSTSVLRMGPFSRDNQLAVTYLRLKEVFPNAVILEDTKPIVITKPEIKTVEKKVYIKEEVPVEVVDDTLWTALFGLAIIGILFMFLSSEQIKRLKKEHEKIKTKHKKLEEKQHEVLSSMGENIHTLAKETMGHTSILAEKVKETPLEEEMELVMYNENELLDVTSDLIKFLRLKSKKVSIQNEAFNFNHVLNEVAGMLNNTFKKSDIELIFNIHKEVPRYMLADSLHLGQVLTNLLEYVAQNSESKEIKLEVTSSSSLTEGLRLRFSIDTDIVIENKEALFDSYYDESTRRYVGLGLFVAKELTYLMDGHLLVSDREGGFNSLVLTIPVEEKNKEKRKYHLPNKALVGKKILIVDTNMQSAQATERLFNYFKAKVTLFTEEKFHKNMPNFEVYDIVALNNNLLGYKTLESLKKVKMDKELKVISLNNLYTSSELIEHELIDINLIKPLTQEYVFDTLVELYEKKEPSPAVTQTEDSLLVYRDDFEEAEDINLESFKAFKGAHILIVEDNVINQKVVLSVLGKSNMILHVAGNGKEAVDFMKNSVEPIDFVFMDINMPVLDGFSAAQMIRSDSRFNHVPIIALTALVSEHEIEKMFESGMNGYLPKPVRIEKMYSALSMFIKNKKVAIEETQGHVEMLFDGLDIKEGLSHMKESDVFYREVLREFMDAYLDSDLLFEKLVREKRFAQVKMLCLDMKGLTGTIGAKEMHYIINEIHQHLIYKKPELLDAYISRYKNEFMKLSNSIERYLST